MSSPNPPPPIQQAILSFSSNIRPQLVYIALHGVFGGVLITMLLALFAFSSAKRRQTTMFICAVITLVLGLVDSISQSVASFRGILKPFTPFAPSAVVYLGLITSIPVIGVDVLLFCRLLAVFPLSLTRRRTILAVYTLPILLKLCRVGLLIGYGVQFVDDYHHGRALLNGLDTNPIQLRLYMTVWFCQAFDNAFAAVVFVWKLRGSFLTKPDSGRLTDGTGNSLAGRIRAICIVAATTFVLPVPFYVTVLILLMTRSSLDFTYVWVVGVQNYVCIIASLFATVWAPGVAHFFAASPDQVSAPVSALRFHAQDGSSGNVARNGNLNSSPDIELSATLTENTKKQEENMRANHPLRVRVDWSQETRA